MNCSSNSSSDAGSQQRSAAFVGDDDDDDEVVAAAAEVSSRLSGSFVRFLLFSFHVKFAASAANATDSCRSILSLTKDAGFLFVLSSSPFVSSCPDLSRGRGERELGEEKEREIFVF